MKPVLCLAVAPDCSSCFSGSTDMHLASCGTDVPCGHVSVGPQMPLQQQGLPNVAIKPDGRIAAMAWWGTTVRVWHSRKRQLLAVLRWPAQSASGVFEVQRGHCTWLLVGGTSSNPRGACIRLVCSAAMLCQHAYVCNQATVHLPAVCAHSTSCACIRWMYN